MLPPIPGVHGRAEMDAGSEDNFKSRLLVSRSPSENRTAYLLMTSRTSGSCQSAGSLSRKLGGDEDDGLHTAPSSSVAFALKPLADHITGVRLAPYNANLEYRVAGVNAP